MRILPCRIAATAYSLQADVAEIQTSQARISTSVTDVQSTIQVGNAQHKNTSAGIDSHSTNLQRSLSTVQRMDNGQGKIKDLMQQQAGTLKRLVPKIPLIKTADHEIIFENKDMAATILPPMFIRSDLVKVIGELMQQKRLTISASERNWLWEEVENPPDCGYASAAQRAREARRQLSTTRKDTHEAHSACWLSFD